ncbi:hypothetical protein AQJ91_20310 [Streptomyces dysideae]|uniref:Uncharacterized protein n=1 Tax=Streptomyces dysideae TaxID=909626 RepID=A0A124IET6_9ACTN|nr:hypothetical protein AQJ91_20310 [Streptomyces dysideae]
MEAFRARRARHAGAVEGLTAVVAALQRAQASALLLNTPVELSVRPWAGSEPTQIALSATDLESFGVLGFQEDPPGAALNRALVRTGAELVVVAREELPLEDGVGRAAAVHRPGGARVTPRRRPEVPHRGGFCLSPGGAGEVCLRGRWW